MSTITGKVKTVKIKSIKKIGKRRVYDISMPKNHNFMLSNGILTHNTKVAMDALRNLMETYSANCFFILSCNYVNKIIDPIKSRCVLIDFAKCYDKDETLTYLKRVTEAEGLGLKGVNDDVLNRVLDVYKPNIRNMVMFLQRVKVNPSQALQEIANKDVYDEFWQYFKDKKYHSMRAFLDKYNIDVEQLNKWLFDKIISNYKELGGKRVTKCIKIIADNERDFVSGADKVLIFNCALFEMMVME